MGIANKLLTGFNVSRQFIEQIFCPLQQFAMFADCIDRETLDER